MHLLIKLLVGIALIALIIAKVDVAASLGLIAKLPYSSAIAVVLISFFALFVQAAKTHILLPVVSVLRLFRINIISQIYAILLFGQLAGDVAKAGYLGRSSIALHRIVAAVAVDRITGLIALLLLGVAGLLVDSTHFDPLVGRTLFAAMAILLGAVVALLLVREGLLRKLFLFLPEALSLQLIRTVQSAQSMSSDLPILLKSIMMGILFQGIVIANTAWLGFALGIDLPLTIWAVVICTVSLVLLVPVSIGGVGIRDVTLLGLLGGFGTAPERAIALSLAMLGIQLIMAGVGFLLTLSPTNRRR